MMPGLLLGTYQGRGDANKALNQIASARATLVVRSDSSHTENPQNCLSKNHLFCRDSRHRYNYTEII